VYVDDECKTAWKWLREKYRREKETKLKKHGTCSQLWASS